MNALKCRTLGLHACANAEKARAIDTQLYYVNGKYTEDIRQKTETEQKEACYLTPSRTPGRV